MHRSAISITVALGLVSASAAQMSRNYHLEDVNWTISFNEEQRAIHGDVTNTLTPLQDDIKQVALNEGKLSIQKVTVNGQDATFTIDASHEQMVINLPTVANKGDQLKLRVIYSGKPEAGVYFVQPDRSERKITTGIVYTQGEAEDTRYWLPTYDEPDDKATSECHIVVPAGYYALSNGMLLDAVHHGPTDIFHWKIDQPHSTYLISFVAGKEVPGNENWTYLPVNWYVPEGTADMGAPTFGGTADMVRFYSELTKVRYPYAKFAQTAVPDFPFGGMENISAVTQTIDALHPPSEAAYADTRGLVLHELAHQWFGDLETCQSWAHIWLNEGFATFLPHFYMRYKEGDDQYQLERLSDMESALMAMQFGAQPMVESKYNVPMDLFNGNAYEGGSARLFTLQALLGEQTFWKSIHQFLVDYSYKSVTTDQFFKSIEASSGKDLDAFEREYFHTAALPHVTASKSGTTLTLTQTSPDFSLDLDVWEWEGTDWKKQTVALRGDSVTVTLDNADDVYIVDPLVNWLAEVKYSQTWTADQLSHLYTNAPNAAAKERVLEQGFNYLIQSPKGPYRDWILATLSSEKSVPLRRYISRSLPDSFQDTRLSLANDPDPETSMNAIEQLSRSGTGAAVVSRLKEVWSSSQSVALRSAALAGLLRLTKDRQLGEKAWHMDSYDDSYRTAYLNWLAEFDTAQARLLSLKALEGGYSENVRQAAIDILGRVKDSPGRKTVFNALLARLQDPSLHEKMATVQALVGYHDPAALPALRKLNDFSMYQLRVEVRQAEESLAQK